MSKKRYEDIIATLSACRGLSPELDSAILRYSDLVRREINSTLVTIAVVGEFNSGKSTFLNSVLGAKIFASANEECTAVPTVVSNGEIRYGIRNSGAWVDIDADSFTKAQKTFSKEVDRLSIRGDFPLLKELDISLIDTPGANSKTTGTNAITVNALADADACIVLMDSAQDGSASFLSFVDQVRTVQSRLFFALSRCDMRSDEEMEEHYNATAPRLCERFSLTNGSIFFVGAKESKAINLPSHTFRSIWKEIKPIREKILSEKLRNLSQDLQRELTPLLAREEENVNQAAIEVSVQPDSFEDLWAGWRRSYQEVNWAGVSEAFKCNFDSQTELVKSGAADYVIRELEGRAKELDALAKKTGNTSPGILLLEIRNTLMNFAKDIHAELVDEHARKLEKSILPLVDFLKNQNITFRSMEDATSIPIVPNSGLERFFQRIYLMPRVQNHTSEAVYENLVTEGPQNGGDILLYMAALQHRRYKDTLNSIELPELPKFEEVKFNSMAASAAINLLGPLAAVAAGVAVLAYNALNASDHKEKIKAPILAWTHEAADKIRMKFQEQIESMPRTYEDMFLKMTVIFQQKHGGLFSQKFSEIRSTKIGLEQKRTVIEKALCQLNELEAQKSQRHVA